MFKWFVEKFKDKPEPVPTPKTKLEIQKDFAKAINQIDNARLEYEYEIDQLYEEVADVVEAGEEEIADGIYDSIDYAQGIVSELKVVSRNLKTEARMVRIVDVFVDLGDTLTKISAVFSGREAISGAMTNFNKFKDGLGAGREMISEIAKNMSATGDYNRITGAASARPVDPTKRETHKNKVAAIISAREIKRIQNDQDAEVANEFKRIISDVNNEDD